MDDPINPAHYKGGRWESIEVIEAYKLGFHLGNAWKYLCRYQKKGGRQDIEKARWYLVRAQGERAGAETLPLLPLVLQPERS